MSKDYYLVLRVPPDASGEEIRSAFRHRAMEMHPDVSGANSDPFLEAQQAYSVLGHPDRRAEYDSAKIGALRATHPQRHPSRKPMAEPMRAEHPLCREISLLDSFQTFSPSFEEVFDRIWENFANVTRSKGESLESLVVEVPLSPEEAFAGGSVRVMVPGQASCPTCRGRGSVGTYHCYKCDGRGILAAHLPIVLSYPPGTRKDSILRVRLENFGIHNFYLTVRFRVSDEI